MVAKAQAAPSHNPESGVSESRKGGKHGQTTSGFWDCDASMGYDTRIRSTSANKGTHYGTDTHVSQTCIQKHRA